VDLTRAHPARVYDYLLGGKDNFAADRAAGDAMILQLPSLPTMARANRAFLRRAVHHLVADRGIRQFLDIGSGIPAVCNVHQVAQATDATARVVYVDNDPAVAAHSRALLTDTPDPGTGFLAADATDPDELVADLRAQGVLDLTRPVALLLVSVLMYFDDETVRRIVRTLMAALPSGSHLTISHPTADFDPDVVAGAVAAGRAAGLTYIPRSDAQLAELFADLELVEPGVVPLLAWHPDTDLPTRDVHGVYYWVGMARKP
jgi:O-methyltransferase involved in polyketide biosynthesis